jgi:hypothetical protein
MGQLAKMEGHLCDGAAVVGDQAAAAACDGGLFHKLLVGGFEPRHGVIGLLHHGVVLTFLEAHDNMGFSEPIFTQIPHLLAKNGAFTNLPLPLLRSRKLPKV